MVPIVLVLLLFVVFTGTAAAEDEALQTDTGGVVAAVQAALDNHDVKRAGQFFADDATILSTTAVVGRESIREWLASQYPADATVEVSPYASSGARVTWMSRVTRGYAAQQPRFQLSWDEAVVIDGRVKFWSTRPLTGSMNSMSMPPQFQRASTLDKASATQPTGLHGLEQVPAPLVSAGVGMLVALGAGVAFGLFHSPSRQQRHGGQLLAALHHASPASTAARIRDP